MEFQDGWHHRIELARPSRVLAGIDLTHQHLYKIGVMFVLCTLKMIRHACGVQSYTVNATAQSIQCSFVSSVT